MKIFHFICLIIFCILFLGVASCSYGDEDDAIDYTFSGHYKVVSILADKEIDLNNDGFESNDLLSEMSANHNVTVILCPANYDPDLFEYYAEVRPLHGSTNNARSIDLMYPYQVFPYEEEDDYSVMTYLRWFNNYSYEYIADGQIKIIDNDPEFNTQYGTVNRLLKINNDSFSINMTIKLYNFKAKKWVQTDIKIIYQKVKF